MILYRYIICNSQSPQEFSRWLSRAHSRGLPRSSPISHHFVPWQDLIALLTSAAQMLQEKVSKQEDKIARRVWRFEMADSKHFKATCFAQLQNEQTTLLIVDNCWYLIPQSPTCIKCCVLLMTIHSSCVESQLFCAGWRSNLLPWARSWTCSSRRTQIRRVRRRGLAGWKPIGGCRIRSLEAGSERKKAHQLVQISCFDVQ